MLRQSQINMYRNILQLNKMEGCRFVRKTRDCFSVELSIRNGRYLIRIDYRINKYPEVYLISPEIDMSSFIEIHTYGEVFHKAYGRTLPLLCLTHYESDKWNSSVLLTESYIPWAIEWTEFYELWLLTGVWYGDGIHPGESEWKSKKN